MRYNSKSGAESKNEENKGQNEDFIFQNKKMLEFANIANQLFWNEEAESFIRKEIEI